MVAAVTAATSIASASLVDVQPRPLGVFVVEERPDVPEVLRVVASEDTWNNARSASSRHGNDPRLAIANASPSCLVIASASCTTVRNARSYVKFDLSTLPSDATIESATIRMVGGPATISSTPVLARRVTSSWRESTMTFDDRPSTTGSGVVTGTAVESGGIEVLTFDVRSAVAARATATLVHGWELRSNGNNDSWWYSSEWGIASERPTLTVTYR